MVVASRPTRSSSSSVRSHRCAAHLLPGLSVGLPLGKSRLPRVRQLLGLGLFLIFLPPLVVSALLGPSLLLLLLGATDW